MYTAVCRVKDPEVQPESTTNVQAPGLHPQPVTPRQPTPLLQAAHSTITGSPHHYYSPRPPHTARDPQLWRSTGAPSLGRSRSPTSLTRPSKSSPLPRRPTCELALGWPFSFFLGDGLLFALGMALFFFLGFGMAFCLLWDGFFFLALGWRGFLLWDGLACA